MISALQLLLRGLEEIWHCRQLHIYGKRQYVTIVQINMAINGLGELQGDATH